MAGQAEDVQMDCRMTTLLLALVTVVFTTAVSAAPVATPGAPEDGAASDPAARRFVTTCAGCHTVGGGKRSGPDLIAATSWTKADLKPAIKRMEQRVGPLTEADLEQLADLVKDPAVNTRLNAAEALITHAFAAKLDPASPTAGRDLFFGAKPFANGGMACASCHAVQGRGGLLGPDLTGVHARMGDTPLASAIEKAGFKMMAPAYRDHPVTRQEALHVTKYLGSLNPVAATASRPPTWTMGWMGAAVFLGAMAWLKQKGRFGQRIRLERRRK